MFILNKKFITFKMQRDRNIPDLNYFVESSMWMESTFIISILRMWWYKFSYNSICLSLWMIYIQLIIIKYGVNILIIINEICNIIRNLYITAKHWTSESIVSTNDWYKKKKNDFDETVVNFMEITIGRPIMAPFHSWGMRNNESDFEISDNENNVGEEAYRDYGQATADSDDDEDIDSDIDSDSDSDNEADDELEVKNDEPDDEPGNGEEGDEKEEKGDEKEEDYEVVTNAPKVPYNLRQRKKKKSWTSIFY